MKKVLTMLLTVFFVYSYVYADIELARDRISKLFPNFKPVEIKETPIAGLYELMSENGDVIYAYPTEDSGYLFFGELWTMQGKSLTQESREQFAIKALEKIDVKDAIKIGKGKHQVIAFIDPQCPYCKKGIEYFLERGDTTLHIFFVPIFGERSKEKSIYAICSKDMIEALRKVADSNSSVNKVEGDCRKEAEEKIKKAITYARPLGIRGVPVFIIDKKIIYGANFVEIEKIIGAPSTKNQKTEPKK